MKRIISLVLVVAMLFTLISVLASCRMKGEQGVQGENGATGNRILKVEVINGELWITYTNDPDVPVNMGKLPEEANGTDGLAYYPLPDGTYGVMAGTTGYLSEITIPATYKGKAVTKILPKAFQNATNLIMSDLQNLNLEL